MSGPLPWACLHLGETPVLHFRSSFQINGRCCCLHLPPPLCLLPHRTCQVRYTPVHQPEAPNRVCLTLSVRIRASLCASALLFPEAGRAGGTRSSLCPPYILTPKAESVGLRGGFGGRRQTHLSPSTGSAPSQSAFGAWRGALMPNPWSTAGAGHCGEERKLESGKASSPHSGPFIFLFS